MAPPIRCRLARHLEELREDEMKKFKLYLEEYPTGGQGSSSIPRGQMEKAKSMELASLMVEHHGEQGAWEMAITILDALPLKFLSKRMVDEGPQLDHWVLENNLYPRQRSRRAALLDLPHPAVSGHKGGPAIRERYQAQMGEKFRILRDRNSRPGESEALRHRFTRLLCLPEHRQREEKEHELLATGVDHARAMEIQGQFVEVNALFDPDQERRFQPKTVVLQGAAGIGKTVLARKVMLDWAEGNFYEDAFHYVFYLNCREMNILSERSLADLISVHLGDSQVPFDKIMSQPGKLLFIVDGFDELKWVFEEQESDLCHDWRESRPVPVLVSSLLRKILLPEAYLLITSRLTALDTLNRLLLHPRHVEILGFSAADRKEYFRKYFRDENQATQAFSLVEDNETLFTMCFVPLVCWIVCTCLKQQLKRGEDLTQTSRTTTALYVSYLTALFPASQDHPGQDHPPGPILRRLCHLAAEGLWTRKILFDGDDLRKHGLYVSDVSPFLQMSIFQKDIDCENCYSFIHLSIQEFFAAMFYTLGPEEGRMNCPDPDFGDVKKLLEKYRKSHETGFLTLTVRFLFGLLNEERVKMLENKFNCKISQEIKRELLHWSQNQCEFLQQGTLFECLYEIQEEEFVAKVMDHFQEVDVCFFTKMTFLASSFCLKQCQNLKKIKITAVYEEESRQATEPQTDDPENKSSFNFTCWTNLLSVLSTNQSLTELSLRFPQIDDLTMLVLCDGLKQPNCRLQKLMLERCHLTAACCPHLASALIRNQNLIHLDLTGNNLGDGGAKLVFEALRHANCHLQSLRLEDCSLTAACCRDLCSALTSNRNLIYLHLGRNELGDTGVTALCEALKTPSCSLRSLCFLPAELGWATWLQLQVTASAQERRTRHEPRRRVWSRPRRGLSVRMQDCGLTDACCPNLASVLRCNQNLVQLKLWGNDLKDSGVDMLSGSLRAPQCRLQELGLGNCKLTDACCERLSSALGRNRTLIHLDLQCNFLTESGVQLLHGNLRNLSCTLTI
ncbi:NACHT, LRR and PYD domains-containing protein 3-like [Tachyglossus aculeatus]|uniref:NACHT, LRR and PYD domains-containing protein 3-like n=1 Tax=Tachyglossus aculeatus TaxID=9261 RepID=UPI0018F3126C|nr:NACHT, LRR and PYD domains-containing protein 3-like [Tachyglossus aculeatus]